MPVEKSDIANIYDHQAIYESPKKTKKTTNAPKRRLTKNRLKAKILGAYYGHPAHDMKLIVVTGTTGKTTVANFIYHILTEAGEHAAVLASEGAIKTGMLHKFLADAWKAGVNYVVTTAPAESLEDDLFAELDIFAAVLTDYIPSRINDQSATDYEAADDTLFDLKPNYVILNRDDIHYPDFEKSFTGATATFTYGEDRDSTVRIETSRLYKLGSEASLRFDGRLFTVASFLPEKPTISYMACAAALASALGLDSKAIENGIAAYDPNHLLATPESEAKK